MQKRQGRSRKNREFRAGQDKFRAKRRESERKERNTRAKLRKENSIRRIARQMILEAIIEFGSVKAKKSRVPGRMSELQMFRGTLKYYAKLLAIGELCKIVLGGKKVIDESRLNAYDRFLREVPDQEAVTSLLIGARNEFEKRLMERLLIKPKGRQK